MRYSRRTILGFFAVLFSPVALMSSPAQADKGRHSHPHRRKPRRMVRRRVRRRRIRRRAGWRVVHSRRLLIVPLAVAIGWELMVDNRVVVVREVHEHTIVVTHHDGSTQTIEVEKENLPENSIEIEGSEYEVEIEEEVFE